MWLGHLQQPIDNTCTEQLRKILHLFYDIAAAKDSLSSIRTKFADAVARHPHCRLFGDCGGLTFTIRQLCKEIPEFAQDALIAGSNLTNTRVSHRTIRNKLLECPPQGRKRFFYKEDKATKATNCPKCGYYVESFVEVEPDIENEDDN
ncbi:hypothetical protein P154DRAFT_572558 [Amniculicola lignicola CBS 123094]|uniref:Uncharacterized protein n=1 Tax=Amniculicola lignicola CBS 123094 TaxID=1392246 RepID=A0A6A5WRE5_9PLEO|nr:hypothetical protein P154DRAFT_572558 [Amniculicola lignicola CBS 123094]